MNFEFATATRIIFGPGTLPQAGPIAKDFGKRAIVVTGRNPERAERLLSELRSHGVTAVTFPVSGEPELTTITDGVALAKKEKSDLVISTGGGSVLDTGKAVAAMLTNDGDLLDYLEVIGAGKPLTRSPAPFIAIPTTAGTGSEVTRNAVLASPQHKVKVSLRSLHMLPKVALVDPELTYELPPSITASTGLDALTQLIEAYLCSRSNPMTDAVCADGIRRAARSLRQACQAGRHPEAREDMALAGLFGGMALANAGLGAAHGFAGPIGGMFSAPHGQLCAALLPHVLETNLKALRQRELNSRILPRFDNVARWLTGTSDASADKGIDWVRKLVSDLKIPPLRTYGISLADKERIVANAAKASSMKANPIVLTQDELGGILEQAL
jgi:alcohol dehydrogenase class IV